MCVSAVMSKAVGVFVVKAAGDLLIFFFSGVMSWPRGSLLAPVCLRHPHVVITLVSECVPMGQPWAWVLEVGACGVTTTLGSGALARL